MVNNSPILVHTTKGLINIDELVIKDDITLQEYTRTTATEWYLQDELVRRDVNVNILSGLPLESSQENI